MERSKCVKTERIFSCEECGKVAKTKQALERHAAYHKSDRPFWCKMCNQRFKNSDDLGKHFRRLKRDGKYEFACKVCHKHFKSDLLLAKHIEMLGCNSGQTDQSTEISTDNAVATTETVSEVKTHVANDEKQLHCFCKDCEKEFNSASSLRAHYKDEHKELKRHVCLKCGQTLSSKDSLLRHYNIFHQNEFPYSCDLCPQKFKVKESLCRHVKFVHKDGGYRCDICQRIFSQPVNLKKHLAVHSTNKEFSCDICHKEFRWKQSLQKHLLLHGNGTADRFTKLRGLTSAGSERLKHIVQSSVKVQTPTAPSENRSIAQDTPVDETKVVLDDDYDDDTDTYDADTTDNLDKTSGEHETESEQIDLKAEVTNDVHVEEIDNNFEEIQTLIESLHEETKGSDHSESIDASRQPFIGLKRKSQTLDSESSFGCYGEDQLDPKLSVTGKRRKETGDADDSGCTDLEAQSQINSRGRNDKFGCHVSGTSSSGYFQSSGVSSSTTDQVSWSSSGHIAYTVNTAAVKCDHNDREHRETTSDRVDSGKPLNAIDDDSMKTSSNAQFSSQPVAKIAQNVSSTLVRRQNDVHNVVLTSGQHGANAVCSLGDLNRSRTDPIDTVRQIGYIERHKVESVCEQNLDTIHGQHGANIPPQHHNGQSQNMANVNRHDLANVNRQDLANVNRHDLANVNRHDLANVNRHDLANVNRHDLSNVNRQDLANVNRHDLANVNRHDLANVNRHDLANVNRHDLSNVNRHDLANVNRQDLANVNRHDLANVYGVKTSIQGHNLTNVGSQNSVDVQSQRVSERWGKLAFRPSPISSFLRPSPNHSPKQASIRKGLPTKTTFNRDETVKQQSKIEQETNDKQTEKWKKEKEFIHQSAKSPADSSFSKFSLIKHMLSLQNEEGFDKSLFDNPLYSLPGKLKCLQRTAEMHKVSTENGYTEYNLSVKQNIPFQWLGISVKADQSTKRTNKNRSDDGSKTGRHDNRDDDVTSKTCSVSKNLGAYKRSQLDEEEKSNDTTVTETFSNDSKSRHTGSFQQCDSIHWEPEAINRNASFPYNIECNKDVHAANSNSSQIQPYSMKTTKSQGTLWSSSNKAVSREGMQQHAGYSEYSVSSNATDLRVHKTPCPTTEIVALATRSLVHDNLTTDYSPLPSIHHYTSPQSDPVDFSQMNTEKVTKQSQDNIPDNDVHRNSSPAPFFSVKYPLTMGYPKLSVPRSKEGAPLESVRTGNKQTNTKIISHDWNSMGNTDTLMPDSVSDTLMPDSVSAISLLQNDNLMSSQAVTSSTKTGLVSSNDSSKSSPFSVLVSVAASLHHSRDIPSCSTLTETSGVMTTVSSSRLPHTLSNISHLYVNHAQNIRPSFLHHSGPFH